jgi:hypothetical protein
VLDIVGHHRRGGRKEKNPKISIGKRSECAPLRGLRLRGVDSRFQFLAIPLTGFATIVSPKRVNSVNYLVLALAKHQGGDSMRGLVLLAACAIFLPAHAEEGMWTFDDFPAAAIKRSFGVDITPRWLEHVRLSTLRLTS